MSLRLPSRLGSLGLVLVFFAPGAPASASTFTELADRSSRDEPDGLFEVSGLLRTRSELLYNLDLDRGLSPSGLPLFPVPAGDPNGQTLTHADMRFRTELGFILPEQQVAVRTRIDVLDNLSLGSLPEGVQLATTRQTPPNQAFRLKHAYGQIVLPIGLLQVGRMGSDWGLGMLVGGGDCDDCDHGDVADRIAFATPLIGHIFAVAYDISASGPLFERKAGGRELDFTPSDDVRSITVAALRYHDTAALARRADAGKITVDYGAYFSYRWQDLDAPVSYLDVANPPKLDTAQFMARGFNAYAVDGWVRVLFPRLRLEAELAYLRAEIAESSLIPGVSIRSPVTSDQIGAAVESELALPDDWSLGLDLGFASGDSAPGFGAFVPPESGPAAPGELEGQQIAPLQDTTIDNFRFHPDYRIDRILFREIIGTVTDAYYLRPHVRWSLLRSGGGDLYAELAGVGTFAAQASSTPSGARPLGVEVDPSIGYTSEVGLRAALDYAVLFPLSAFDNPAQSLSAKPAQLLRLRVGFWF